MGEKKVNARGLYCPHTANKLGREKENDLPQGNNSRKCLFKCLFKRFYTYETKWIVDSSNIVILQYKMGIIISIADFPNIRESNGYKHRPMLV